MRKQHYYIYVPKTIEAMYEQEYGKWSPEDLYLWELTENEFDILWHEGIFELLNKQFKMMIDEFEEEQIFYQPLYFCKKELLDKLKQYKCSAEINKLQQMIEYAIDARTLICFVL